MFQDGSIALFQYWNRLRAGRPAPLRTEIAPSEIKSLLPDTFILERNARGAILFRLAGTRICAIYGKELRGTAFTSLWTGGDQQAVTRIMRRFLADKSALYITFEGATGDGRLNGFELLLLPLGSDDDHTRVLGTLQPVHKPFWLGADPVCENRLESFRLIDPDREPLLLSNRKTVSVPPLLPDGQALVEAFGSNVRRIRHLLVFEGGRRS
ncbi:PAS domain-containing protein [Chelativorans sp. J32]|uniref:PAS domain-containing protein n=1 Tax=Chelativorans sp. J32 TaxID=935840 RepID=UPI00048A0166|nr:PAS domain-containing protein [Chelativorans sp. J32]